MSTNTNEMDTWFRNAGLIDEGGERIENTSRTERDLKKLRERARKESEKFVSAVAIGPCVTVCSCLTFTIYATLAIRW